MLADQLDYVIGVDTHKHSHSAAVLTPNGGVVAERRVNANLEGYEELVELANKFAPARRVWAVEGSGSYGQSLTRHLQEAGESVVEGSRPTAGQRRGRGKSDQLDAIAIGRATLAAEQVASPRQGGERMAILILQRSRESAVDARARALCQLQDLVVRSFEDLRARLLPLNSEQLVKRCLQLRPSNQDSVEKRATLQCLRGMAQRIQDLGQEIKKYDGELSRLLQTLVPSLLAESGVGPVSAAQAVISWSHPGRIRNEAAFASLSGTAPIPASSGQTTHNRLNRGGDRQLNRAAHTIVVSRMTHHQETKDYIAKRMAEGKSKAEIRRCLKRYIIRRIFRLLTQDFAQDQNIRTPQPSEIAA